MIVPKSYVSFTEANKAIVNKSDIKRWNTFSCLDQYIAYSDGCVLGARIRAYCNWDFKLNLTWKVKVNHPPNNRNFTQIALHLFVDI